MRREDRDECVHGSGQGQGEGEEEEEEDSMESVMVWAMALVGKREKASPALRYTLPHSNIHHQTTDYMTHYMQHHMHHHTTHDTQQEPSVHQMQFDNTSHSTLHYTTSCT